MSEEHVPSVLLLIVFVHGFKGTDNTFSDFPNRLQHILTESIPNMKVESIVFPAYETKGELVAAVDKFADWLITVTVEREVVYSTTSGGAGRASIVLCGHSMGGLLIADTLIEMASSRPNPSAPLWPKIVALIAFDTPYYGVHPSVFKHKLTEGAGYVQQAGKLGRSLWAMTSTSTAVNNASPASRSGWSKWTPAAYGIGGALVAGAAVGTAYWKKDELGFGRRWITDHMKYVGNLWNQDSLVRRMDKVEAICKELGIKFRCIYTLIPSKPPEQLVDRQFILLPESPGAIITEFTPNLNGLAPDEVAAHIGMFDARSNEAYYQLGIDTSTLIHEVISEMKHHSPGNNVENSARVQDPSNAEVFLTTDDTNHIQT